MSTATGNAMPREEEMPVDPSNDDQNDVNEPDDGQNKTAPPHQTVRFSSVNQEIEPVEPEESLQTVRTLTEEPMTSREDLSPEAQEEIRQLSLTLKDTRLQQHRLANFAFEPVSLPASRVPSNESSAQHSTEPSPRPTPQVSAMHSPPLTPAGSQTIDAKPFPSDHARQAPVKEGLPSSHMTPEVSPPHNTPPPTTVGKTFDDHPPASTSTSRPSTSDDQPSTRQSSASDASGVVGTLPKHTPKFTIGPTGDSLPPSREGSPPTTPGSTSGTATPYSRPFTPAGDRDDPYARSRRPPQSKNVDAIDPRFIFNGRDARKPHGHSSSTHLPRSAASGTDLKAFDHKPHFGFHGFSRGGSHATDDGASGMSGKPQGSFTELKRFFRLGGSKGKRGQSPARSAKSGTRTPPSSSSQVNVPFADDHGLQTRYGKFGKVLGSGAGGSVRLMKRSSDGTTFAVKQFRPRHPYETEKEYAKKVTAEFCIGSTLHHGNIIETLDIVYEHGNWYEVMEYAPYDLFAIVMTGKMTREEIACCFLQIFSGVTYLHSMGLAHRDLKLDNVVVNEFGIMKIIDFGSAVVFRYPFENDIVKATGVVGSDPYLAPEVLEQPRYDPQPGDIWSLAIIFCCMTLRRFPWKAPKLSDNSYRLFVSAPSPGTPTGDYSRRSSHEKARSAVDLPGNAESSGEGNGHHHHHHHRSEIKSEPASRAGADTPADSSSRPSQETTSSSAPQVIKGPWRLLRLLPRESRHIIGRMLEIDPARRATIEEMLQDPWITQTPFCRQEDGGKVIRAPGHEHTLEPGTGPSPAPSKK